MNPKLSLTHLYLGYICKDEGNEKEAQLRFERALLCNPNGTEALRELRLMSMRKEKEASSPISPAATGSRVSGLITSNRKWSSLMCNPFLS